METAIEVLKEIRDLLRQQRSAYTQPTCCVTLPNGQPIPYAPPYGYDLPGRTPAEIGADYCRRVQAAIETIINTWNMFWEGLSVPPLELVPNTVILFISTLSSYLPESVRNRVNWELAIRFTEIVRELPSTVFLSITGVNLCTAARQYIAAGDNSVPIEVEEKVPALLRLAFFIYWRIIGGVTALVDDPTFTFDPNLYDPTCCLLDYAVVKWQPKYVGPNCPGYTDGFHGLDWYGTSILDENGNDVSSLYPRIQYAFNNLIAFPRSTYAGMYFCNPGYPGQFSNRVYRRDNLDATVCAIYQNQVTHDAVLETLTAHRILPTGSAYIMVANLIGDGRDWYITRQPLPGYTDQDPL